MMKGYDRPQAAAYILKNLQRTSGSDALLPLDQLVEQMIDADEAYMRQAGILDADGNVSTKVFYEDDEAYEFILNTVAGKYPGNPAAALWLASVVDDYMDHQQAYLESKGLMDWA